MKMDFSKVGTIVKGLSLAFCVVVISTTISKAQPEDPGNGGTVGNESGVPIDGGISALLIAGVTYGAKKLYKNKKAVQVEN